MTTMKTLLKSTFTTLIVCATLFSFAQDDKVVEAMMTSPDMTVSSRDVKIKKDIYSALSMKMSAESGDVEKAAKKYFADKYNADFSKNKDFMQAENVLMTDIANETGTLMTRVVDENGLSRLDVIVMLKGSAVNQTEHPVAYTNLTNVMKGFARTFYLDQYSEILDDQRKELSSEEKTLEKSIKAGEKLTKSINSNQSDIQKAESDIVKTEQAIRDAQAKLEQLKADIDNRKNEIEKLQGEVEKNKKEIADQQKKVDEKKAKVDKIQSASDSVRN